MRPGDQSVVIENVLVGVFGAFMGGDFLVTFLNGGVVNDTDFKMSSLGIAVAGAVLMLFVLAIMRRMVGPMRISKTRSRDRS